MLKGLALTPPVIGRISIGKVVARNGKRLPEKDDEFTITSQVQDKEGWIPHAFNSALRKTAGEKLRSIPVRLLFDDPELNLRANYSLFDRQTGRPLCVGNGETCRRSLSDGVRTLPCPSPEGCELARGGNCKPYGRLNVRIGGEGEHGNDEGRNDERDDELGSFVFRTTGFNSIRTLATRLSYFHAISGGNLSLLPLELVLRGKSTTQSHRAPIYYVDLVLQSGKTLTDAVASAKAEKAARLVAGFDQAVLDEAARKGFAAGAFEESEEDGPAIVEEFFPQEGGDGLGERPTRNKAQTGLLEKLEGKAGLLKKPG